MKDATDNIRVIAELKVAFSKIVGDCFVFQAVLCLPITTVYLFHRFSVKMFLAYLVYLAITYILIRFLNSTLYFSAVGYDARVEYKIQDMLYETEQKKNLLAQSGALSPSGAIHGSLSFTKEGSVSLHTKDPA